MLSAARPAMSLSRFLGCTWWTICVVAVHSGYSTAVISRFGWPLAELFAAAAMSLLSLPITEEERFLRNRKADGVVTRGQFLIVTTFLILVVVNGLAMGGDGLANAIDNTMQLVVGVAAVTCGVIGARRHRGRRLLWRLVLAVGMAGWSFGRVVVWTGGVGLEPVGPPRSSGVSVVG